jgi:hypothetical protein
MSVPCQSIECKAPYQSRQCPGRTTCPLDRGWCSYSTTSDLSKFDLLNANPCLRPSFCSTVQQVHSEQSNKYTTRSGDVGRISGTGGGKAGGSCFLWRISGVGKQAATQNVIFRNMVVSETPTVCLGANFPNSASLHVLMIRVALSRIIIINNKPSLLRHFTAC